MSLVMEATPLARYHALIAADQVKADPEQADIVAALDDLHQRLTQQILAANAAFAPIKQWFKPPPVVTGIYLWGSVGIGKTFLMDLFYNSLNFSNKKRLHFHEFMAQVHQQLNQLQGTRDPLKLIAENLRADAQVLCLDEFIVTDITDAVVLAKLLQHLFINGVCLVTTSNTAPDELYYNGLQREQFLPAITLLKRYTTVIHAAGQQDYRLLSIKQAGVFYTPLSEDAQAKMQAAFLYFARGTAPVASHIELWGRTITVWGEARGVIGFEFLALCGVPRAKADYLALAQEYHTVLICNVPVIRAEQHDLICNLIQLIDVFYDKRIHLVISAATPAEALYPEGRFLATYRRTLSRLIEMQSVEYFQQIS